MEGHDTLYNADLDFYWGLPDHKEEYQEERKDVFGYVTRVPSIPRPDVLTLLVASGTAILSSAGLAGAIKAYLLRHKTKISIEDRGSQLKVAYEGPRLKNSKLEIKEILDTMSDYIDIRAEKLPRVPKQRASAKK
jgi:hypothetical protein